MRQAKEENTGVLTENGGVFLGLTFYVSVSRRQLRLHQSLTAPL